MAEEMVECDRVGLEDELCLKHVDGHVDAEQRESRRDHGKNDIADRRGGSMVGAEIDGAEQTRNCQERSHSDNEDQPAVLGSIKAGIFGAGKNRVARRSLG